MNSRIVSVVLMFFASIYIGWNLVNTTEVVQAQPVIPSYLELMSMTHSKTEEKKSAGIDTINVSVDISTHEVSVNGTTDAIVNVTTTGEIKPIVKYRTKVKEVNTGFPKVSSIANLPEDTKPLSPFTKKQL
ncbi:hypothetical protein [uncultured phage cr56_1]|uniref:Uncharacterized protein n=1 Tax=uncultured phage cr56_1 TaxID=2772081 RepID=A0A7M1RQV9_9CAUD|nr:hypothetical protein KNV48_gp19 [uncultured phage cr56_1]QOR56825.1 hypothetical protein [uncultured phage cr56_1]